MVGTVVTAEKEASALVVALAAQQGKTPLAKDAGNRGGQAAQEDLFTVITQAAEELIATTAMGRKLPEEVRLVEREMPWEPHSPFSIPTAQLF